MAENKRWMQNLDLKKGALRKTLGVKKGEDIPMGELRDAAKGEGVSEKTAKRARLAMVFRKAMKKKKKKNGMD